MAIRYRNSRFRKRRRLTRRSKTTRFRRLRRSKRFGRRSFKSRRYGRRRRGSRRGRIGRRRSFGRRRRGGRRFRRAFRKRRSYRAKTRRFSKRSLSGAQIYSRVDAKVCNVAPGKQHFRDFVATGMPTCIAYLLGFGQGEYLRRMRKYQDRSIVAGNQYTYPVVLNIDPTKIRQRVKERATFTCYNTGTTMAYITVTRCYWRKTLNTSRPLHILGTLPANHVGGPTIGTTFSTVTPSCTVYGHGIPTTNWAALYDFTDSRCQYGWRVDEALLGSDTTGATTCTNLCIGRSLHAKMQLNPWAMDRYWYRGAGILGSGGTFHAGGIIPYTGSTPVVGTTSYDAVNFRPIWQINPTSGSQGVFTIRDGDSNTSGVMGVGLSTLPEYHEDRKGPLDRVFRRFSRRIKLAPGQSYTFSTSSRTATFNPILDGYWLTSAYNVPTTAATIAAGNPDSLRTWWDSNGSSDSTNTVYPTAPYVYGKGEKTRTQYVSFAIRGNTTVTSAGMLSVLSSSGGQILQENGPAQVLIKRRYIGMVKTWEKKQERLKAIRVVDAQNDSTATATSYVNMYPTSAPISAPYAAL